MTVTIKQQWWGLKQAADLCCDRCESQLEAGAAIIYRLCEACAKLPPEQIRPHTFFHSSSGYDGPYFRTSVLHKHDILTDCHCAVCDAAIGGELAIHDVCEKCVSQHPDISHTRWSSDALVPWRGKKRTWQDEFDVRHCLRCSGVQVAGENAAHELEFTYYQRGFKHAVAAYTCDRQPYEDHWARVGDCHHDWMMIEDRTVEDTREVVRKLRTLFSQPQIGEVDARREEHFIRMAHGMTYHWCWKCGHFQTLCPGMPDVTLPESGDTSR